MHWKALQETGSRACGLLLACALTFSGVALAPAVEGDLHPIAVVPASSSIAFRGPTGVAFLPDGDAATFEQTVFVADPLSKSVTGVEVDGTLRGPWYGAGGELFVEPTDVACDLSGHVFVADKGRPYVYKLDAATGALVEKIGGGLLDAVGIDWLEDTGGAHKIFVADEGHSRVVRFGDAADTSEGAWYTAGAQLYRPADVEAPLGSGVIWVTDADRDMVFCIDLLNDMPVYSWGESGTDAGKLSIPVGIAVRSDYGNDVVVSDAGGRIQRFTQGGVHVSTLVEPGLARGNVSSPQRISLDGANDWFWVAERDGGRVQLFNGLGGAPEQPSVRGGGRGAAWGEFDSPGALAVAGGWLLVCDTGNNRVQAIDINHDTPMHAFGSEGTGDGQFLHPGGIAVGPDGSIFVSDTLSDRVQKFSASGDHIASWGSTGSGPGNFSQPKGIAVDSQGFVYVADSGNYRIVKLAPNGDPVTSWSSYVYASATRNLYRLSDIAIGPEDHLFVYDGFNGRGGSSSNYWVPEFDSDGGLVQVHFDFPSGGLDGRWGGLAVSAARTIYLSENDSAYGPKIRMQAWQPAFFEDGYHERSDRGIAPGRFEMTGDVAIAPFGMLFVSDPALHRVQRLEVEDATPPRTNFTGPGDGWLSDDALVSINRPTDGLAGPMRTWLSVNGEEPYTIWDASQEATANPSRTVRVTEEGTTTVEFFAEDAFGNREETRSVPVRIDRHVPEATVTVSPSGWTTRNVEVSVAATDTGSGIASIEWSTNRDGVPLTSPVTYESTVTLTEEAVTGVRFDVRDASGKLVIRGGQAKIDRTPPVTTLYPFSVEGGVQLWPSVAGAGAETEGGSTTWWRVGDKVLPRSDYPLELAPGTHAIVYWSVDAAGNIESEQTTSVVVPTGDPGGGDPGGGGAPSGDFLIAGGRPWTNSPTLQITSDVAGAVQMRFKAPGDADWRPWAEYAAEAVIAVDPSEPDGEWTVLAQYRNGTDETADVTDAQATIGVDRIAPHTGSNANEGRAFSRGEQIILVPDDERSGVAEYWYRIGEAAAVKDQTILTPAPGTFRLRWWAVDLAGNIEVVNDRMVTVLKDSTTLAVTSANATIGYGGTYDLTGRLASAGTGITGAQVRVQRLAAGVWVDDPAIGYTGTNGVFSVALKPSARQTYRVRFGGNAEYDAAFSTSVIVTPKAVVGTPVAPSTMYAGKARTVYGALKPRHTASTYPVRIYKYRYVSGKWRSYGYVKAKASDDLGYSRYKASVKLSYRGRWRLRAYHPSDAGHPAAWSSKYDYVTVK